MKKRAVDLVVISDVHLGTYGCHAKELLHYLKSVKPRQVVLNGDIIDVWQFNKYYWPKSHMKVVKFLMTWISKGVKVRYITGNHDEMLRKFSGFKLGSFDISNKIVLELHGKKAWLFHGDVFDFAMQHSRWIAKLGAIGYDFLILMNRSINYSLKKMGKNPISMSRKIKNSVKSAVKFINNFEKIVADIAIENGFDYVVCGHIHHPEIKNITTSNGQVIYLNSGDWVENLTALEYHNGKWTLFSYLNDSRLQSIEIEPEDPMEHLEKKQLSRNLRDEFNAMIISGTAK
jgi:UDP-2,3-diacylglucosamine pyrophosphatase LpxH